MRYNNHASARKLPNGGSENDFFLPLFSLETPPAVWSTAGGVFRGKASQQSGSGEGALFRIPGAIRTHDLPLGTRHGVVVIHDLFWNRTIFRPYIHFYSRNCLPTWCRVWHNTRHSVSKPPKNRHLAGFPNCIGVYDAVTLVKQHGGVLPWAAMPLTAGNDRKKAAALISQNRHQWI